MSTLEEIDFPTAPVEADPQGKLVFRIDGAIHWALDRLWDRIQIAVANLRGPDPDTPTPPAVTLEDLERLIRQSAKDREPGIHITNHGRSGQPPWQNKFLLGVGIALLISAVTTTATTIVTVASIRTKIEDYINSNDHRLERDERQIDRLIDDLQRRLDRGG